VCRLSIGPTVRSTCGTATKYPSRRPTKRFADVDAVWFDPDPASRSGRSVRVIGYSHGRRAILTVILVHDGEGAFYGANGWESSPADRRRYREGQ
jgi:hypothetical protein